MNKVSKKIVLLSALFAAIIMLTGCPQTQLPTEETCVVTFYPQHYSEGFALTVEKGDTLEAIVDRIPEALINDSSFKFISWVTEDGKDFPKNKPIVTDVSLYAKFQKTVVDESSSTGSHKEEETKITDGSSGTVTTDSTTLVDGTEIVKITETVNDSQGKTTTVETTSTTDTEGNITVEETVTHPDGKTTTEVTTSDKISSHKLIEFGINALTAGNIDIAKSYFDEAYKKNPSDDEALLYSALSDLSSIITNKGIQKFFEKHLGIKNYPSTLGNLITGGWLSSSEYSIEVTDYARCCKFYEVKNPDSYGDYYFRAKLTDKSETEDNVYHVCDYSNYGASSWVECFGSLEINGKKRIVGILTKVRCDDLMQGTTEYMFGGNYSGNNPYEERHINVELDNDGDYYIRPWWNNGLSDKFTAYAMDYDGYEQVSFTYPVTVLAPELTTLENQSWFAGTVKDSSFMYKLLLANILNGNAKGLDSAIDDLYSALFESAEYKNACKKIAAIKKGVAVPEIAVQAFDLEEVLGSSEVIIGATELTLIKDVVNWFKGMLEYLQSYSFSYDLSILKEHWDDLANKYSYSFLLDAVSSYNASVDPIANGFLSVRKAEKITASKNTFLGIINDVITSYNHIISDDSEYPDVIKSFLGDYEGIRDIVVAVKTALENGENYEFDIPGASFNVDFGKLFTSGQFALENLIEIEATSGKPAPKAPVLYTTDKSGNLVKITDAEAFIEAMQSGNMVFLHVKAFNAVDEVTDALSLFMFNGSASASGFIPLSKGVDAYLFNFYYGGLEDFISKAQ